MKKEQNKMKRFVAIFLLFLLTFSGLGIAAMESEKSFGKEPKRDEIKSLESERREIEKVIEKVRQDYKTQVKQYSVQEQELLSLQEKIGRQIDIIDRTELDIQNKIVEIDAKKLEVNKAKADVEEHTQILRKRLRTMYKFGKTGYVQIILRSENIVNALTRLDRIQYVSRHDKKLLEDLKLLQNKLEIAQSELEAEKKALDNLKESQIRQKEALETSYGQELVKKKQAYQNIEALKRQKDQLEAESARITETLRQMTIKRDFVGGQMIWPLDYNHSIITSYFGPRERPIAGATTNHGAIDIAAPTGSNIYAALGGEVIASGYSWGYGNYVMIDHGGGIVTLYGHASQRCVKVGDQVNRGDVIALVGSTGVSTGPHLHFEVRQNGTRVNPLNYVSQP